MATAGTFASLVEFLPSMESPLQTKNVRFRSHSLSTHYEHGSVMLQLACLRFVGQNRPFPALLLMGVNYPRPCLSR